MPKPLPAHLLAPVAALISSHTGLTADEIGQALEVAAKAKASPVAEPKREPLLTVEQAAAALGFTPRHLRNLAKRGDLSPIRCGAKALRYRQADLDAYIERCSAAK